MGGAIAIRIATRVPVAGVIAFSPAPMQAKHGATAETLLFPDAPALPANSLVMNGGLEPEELRNNARDLLQPGRDVNSRYELLPRVTHGGIILSAAALRIAQRWTATALQDALRGVSSHGGGEAALTTAGSLPSRLPLLGFALGLGGLLVITTPFLREITAMSASGSKDIQPRGETQRDDGNSGVAVWRGVLEIIVVGMLIAEVLRYWTPLRLVRLFEGDYLAGYLLLVGLVICGLHWRAFMNVVEFRTWSALGALLGGLILVLLFTAWFELSLSEAWLNSARWQLFPLLFISLIPCLIAEEMLLGPSVARNAKSDGMRVLFALFYRLLVWLPLVFGILILHSGEILMVLLVPYFFLLSVLQRRGMDVVREVTGSAAAAALFGAILLAGFFLVIFPLV